MTTRQSHRAPLRRHPYVLKTVEALSSTNADRQSVLTPAKGYRVRLTRIRVIQTVSDGRHLCEIYFGHAGNLITDPSRGIDVLAVPNLGSASTRTYPKDEGPRGRRGEPVSLRWRGRPPAHAHKIIIEYTEES